MDMKVGDTVIIRGVITKIDDIASSIIIETENPGLNGSNKWFVAKSRVSEVIPAPVTPKAGETWTMVFDNTTYPAKILFVDEISVFFEKTFGGRSWMKTEAFINSHTKA